METIFKLIVYVVFTLLLPYQATVISVQMQELGQVHVSHKPRPWSKMLHSFVNSLPQVTFIPVTLPP